MYDENNPRQVDMPLKSESNLFLPVDISGAYAVVGAGEIQGFHLKYEC